MFESVVPNHRSTYYREMTGAVEEQIFQVDLKTWLKRVLEDVSVLELEETVIQVTPYERAPARRNQRNGFYERNLDTVFGWIEGLRIPRPRHGGFTPHWLGEKFARRQRALNRVALECFYRGVSTRDVDKILRSLCDVSISSSSVSRLAAQWDHEVKRWHRRTLTDDIVYLMLDGIWIKNRSLGRTKRLILVAYGIRSDGTREIIDYSFAQTESEANWLRFLTALNHRGLRGVNLKLITTDGCGGLANAINIAFPTTPHQLCWAHKMRNVLDKVKEVDRATARNGLAVLFEGTWDHRHAQAVVNKWSRRWRDPYPNAVRCIERDLDRLFHYLDCDPDHHKALRTSNHIERQFKEYRRRMRPMEITPNQASADRILYALTQIRNEKLRSRPLPFTQKLLH